MPEAGLVFACAMMLGVLVTLATVALLTIVMRDWVIGIIARHGASMARLTRLLDGISGALLIALSLAELGR